MNTRIDVRQYQKFVRSTFELGLLFYKKLGSMVIQLGSLEISVIRLILPKLGNKSRDRSRLLLCIQPVKKWRIKLQWKLSLMLQHASNKKIGGWMRYLQQRIHGPNNTIPIRRACVRLERRWSQENAETSHTSTKQLCNVPYPHSYRTLEPDAGPFTVLLQIFIRPI